MLDPVLDDLSRPAANRQHCATLRGRSGVGLAVTDLEGAVAAELLGVRVAGEVDGLQVADLVAAQSPAVGGLEQHRVPERRQPALPAQRADAFDLVVGAVEEDLQLLAGERALLRVLLVVLVVPGGVPLVDDLDRVGAEGVLADRVPPVAGVGEVVAEQLERVLVGPDCGASEVVLAAQVAEELVDVGGVQAHGISLQCSRNRVTSRARASMVASARLRASCWWRQPSNMSSTT